MKYAINSAIVLFCVVSLAFAQAPGMKEASVNMSGKNITLKYSALPASGQITGKPALFHTDSNLEVQGLAVPKGDYALFLEPQAGEWQLIITRHKPGTPAALNAKLELGRVPMDMKKAPAPADALRMTLTSYGKLAGKLELTWGSSIASVPFNLDILKSAPEW
jgi:hypothetical protein